MMATCKVCDKFREVATFNIELRPIQVCDSCADSITVQQVIDRLTNASNLNIVVNRTASIKPK